MRSVKRCLSFHDSSSSPHINMDLNRTETPSNNSFINMSEFSCLSVLGFTWDLDDPTTYWSLAAVNIIASPTTVLLNALVMVILTKRKELQRRSNILLFSLAITDLLVGALCMPLTTIADFLIVGQVSPEHGCKVSSVNMLIIFEVLTWASLLTLTMMAWERYVAIRKWMDYKNILTKGRLKMLATVSWLLAIFLGVQIPDSADRNMKSLGLQIFFITRDYLIIGVGLCVPVSILYLYLMVYLGIRQRKKSTINQATAQAKVKLQSKVAKTCALITFALFITYGQKIIISAIQVLYSSHKTVIGRWSNTLLQLNSLLNPLIYCFTDHRFRNAMLELLKIKKPRAIQPATGVVRFARKKDPFSPKDIPENRPRLTRSASCNTLPALDSAYARSSDKLVSKRSLSLPSLGKGNCLFINGSKIKQPMSETTTTVTIHVESQSRFAKKDGPFSPKAVAETPPRLIRSASCNTITALDCRAHALTLQRELKRSMSVPTPGEESSSFGGSKVKQPLSVLPKSETVYPGSGSLFAKKEVPFLPKDAAKTRPRLTSSASFCNTARALDCSHAGTRKKELQISMSAPPFI